MIAERTDRAGNRYYIDTENKARHGGDKRGNNQDRAKRKRWILETFGNGETCNCVHCATELDYHTVEADRIVPGDSYARPNIQPSCRSCNQARGNNPLWRYQPTLAEAMPF